MRRSVLVFGLGVAVALLAAWVAFPRALYVQRQQPFEFRHKTHAEKSGLADCNECHPLRDDGTFSGIPAMEKCAGCHSDRIGDSKAEATLVNDYVFAKASSEGPVVVIDGYPGHAASQVLESFATSHHGEYRVVLARESRSLVPYERWSHVPAASLGYDLENTQTIVSFGVPLLDGWGIPGRFTRMWAEQAAGLPDPKLRLIQIKPALSRTAGRAWQWVPIRDGTDAALNRCRNEMRGKGHRVH